MSNEIVVRIEMPSHMDSEYIETHRGDFFPMGDDRISIDAGILEVDPTDDSFYLFERVELDYEAAALALGEKLLIPDPLNPDHPMILEAVTAAVDAALHKETP